MWAALLPWRWTLRRRQVPATLPPPWTNEISWRGNWPHL
jgi:hypothetical protein